MDRHRLSCEVFFTWLANPFDRYWPDRVHCVGRFFDDPRNCGVVSDGPIEDNGSTAPHSLFILVRCLYYETCDYDLLLLRAKLIGAGSALARASDE